MKRLFFGLLILAGFVAPSFAQQLMTLDPTGTFLMNTFTNQPVFMVGEDAFDLITQLDTADADTYLADRASRGFNVIWVAAADNVYQAGAPDNYYGNAPFSGADFTNENSTYWAHVDLIVSTAASYGIVVGLDPGFAGLTSTQGYLASYQNSSGSVLSAYGAWIGSRYKNYSNIIWILGGDADPTDTALYANLNNLAVGIRSTDTNHLITIEAARFYENGTAAPNSGWSSLDAWGSGVTGSYTPAGSPPSWLGTNWVYDPYSVVQGGCSRNYTSYVTSAPHMPGLMGEAWYEGEHSTTTLQLREEGYWSVLSGCALGYMFGNNPIWCFDSPQSIAGCNTGTTWQSSLSSSGSVAQEWLGRLAYSREFWKMVPDISNAVLTGGIGSGTTISVASCSSDGQTCEIYDPIGNSQVPQIAMGHFSGTVHAWWFNPQTGATTDLGTFTNSGTRTFTPADGNDWILVLDLNSLGLKAPGSFNLLATSAVIDNVVLRGIKIQ